MKYRDHLASSEVGWTGKKGSLAWDSVWRCIILCEEKGLLARLKPTWEYNIKMDNKELGCEGVHWIHWQHIGSIGGPVVKTVMNSWVSWKAEFFLKQLNDYKLVKEDVPHGVIRKTVRKPTMAFRQQSIRHILDVLICFVEFVWDICLF